MPYYNEMYKSELINYNPLYTVNLTTTNAGNNSSDETTSENVSSVNNSAKASNNHEYNTGNSIRSRDEALKESTTATQNNDDYEGISDTPQGGVQGVLISSGDSNYLSKAKYGNKAQNNTSAHSSSLDRDESIDYKEDIKNKYDETSDNTQATSRVLNKSGTTTEQYVRKVLGYEAHPANLIKEFRETFLRLDELVINELETLFFQLW